MGDYPSFIEKTKNGTLIRLHVQPRASRDMIWGLHAGRLKVRVKAPPVDMKANRACQKLLSKILKIPKSRIVLKNGTSSRQKTFLAQDMDPEDVMSRLNI